MEAAPISNQKICIAKIYQDSTGQCSIEVPVNMGITPLDISIVLAGLVRSVLENAKKAAESNIVVPQMQVGIGS